jgi:hypothetical protein
MSEERRKQISEHAYRLWQEEGEPSERALDHWVRAERQAGENSPQPGAQANEGEGNRTVARADNRKTKAFAETGQVEKQAKAAKADLDGPKGGELREAEAIGRSHSHGEDPKVSGSKP